MTTTPRRRTGHPDSVFRPGALVLVLALAGCGISEPSGIPTGVLRVFARSDDGGQYVASPEATFFKGSLDGFPDSRATSDSCVITNLLTTTLNPPISLDAGDSVAFITGGLSVSLYPTTDIAGTTSYVPPAGPVSLTPGAAVTFEIPGAAQGFPAATLTSLTAPSFTSLSPVPGAPPVDRPLTVTWTPVGDDSSRFEIALKFATENSQVINRHVLCNWRDDGSGQIAGNLLAEWSAATIKRIEVSRYRTLQRDLVDGALYFIATFDTVPAVAP